MARGCVRRAARSFGNSRGQRGCEQLACSCPLWRSIQGPAPGMVRGAAGWLVAASRRMRVPPKQCVPNPTPAPRSRAAPDQFKLILHQLTMLLNSLCSALLHALRSGAGNATPGAASARRASARGRTISCSNCAALAPHVSAAVRAACTLDHTPTRRLAPFIVDALASARRQVNTTEVQESKSRVVERAGCSGVARDTGT